MKIGMVCYPTYGGSGVVATELGRELAMRGHEVHFISYARPVRLSNFVQNIYFHEVEMNSYPLFKHQSYGLSLTSTILEVLEYEQLDLIHGHYAIPHAASAYLAKQILRKRGADVKILTTLHGTDITLVGLEPSFLPLVKFSIEESDGVTTVSESLKQKTLANYHIEKDIEVIYNFIDTEHFRPLESRDFRQRVAPAGEKILMHTSNFRPVKRVPDTIEVLKIVKEQGVAAKLVLIGDGPDRYECERFARDLGLQKDVTFLGKQDCLPELLSAADIFLLPSKSESFGLAALEAMACGVPIISSSAGGLPELNIHNQTGFIAESGDAEKFAKYVTDLLSNEKKYAVFSENCRRRALEEFDTQLIIPKYIAYYERILAK